MILRIGKEQVLGVDIQRFEPWNLDQTVFPGVWSYGPKLTSGIRAGCLDLHRDGHAISITRENP